MKYNYLYLLYGLCTLLIIACEKEEIGPRPFPRLETLAVSDITDEGAVFNARVFESGEEEIIRHGFVWSLLANPVLGEDLTESVVGAPADNHFAISIRSSLQVNKPYYVRAFVETSQRVVYGNEISFLSLGSSVPVLTSIEPQRGSWGDTITVLGKFFSTDSSRNQAFLNDVKLSPITASASRLTFRIPPVANDPEAAFRLEVNGIATAEPAVFNYDQVEILAYAPQVLTFGDTVTLTLANLNPDYYSLTLGGEPVEGIAQTESSLSLVVPMTLNMVFPELELQSAGFASRIVLELAAPDLLRFDPGSYAYGDTIRIQHQNIHPDIANNQLRLIDGNEEWSLSPCRWTTDSIFFAIPGKVIPDPSILLRFISGPFSINMGFIRLNTPTVNTLSTRILNEVDQVINASGEYLNSDKDYFEIALNAQGDFVRLPDENILEISSRGVQFKLSRSFFQFFTNAGFNGLGELVFLNHGAEVGRFSVQLENRSLWRRRADFPIAVLGGSTHFPLAGKGYYGIGEIAGRYTNIFYTYDPVADRWTRLPDFEGVPRAHATAIVLENQVLLGLGLGETDDVLQTRGDFYLFDPLEASWTRQADFPGETRYDAQTMQDQGRYFLLGGRNETGSTLNFRDEIWQYLPEQESWQQLDQDLPPFGAAFSLNETGYLSSSFEIYRYDEGQWTPLGKRAIGLGGEKVPIGREIYWGFEEGTPNIAVLDTTTGEEDVKSLNLSSRRIIEYLFTINDLAYFIVEGLAGESPRQVWTFDPSKL
ncbi:MAG TPA: IPT/TIG domain-containing protein [Saprospiraceae bacterium]|nr:IPT/TIG domain-containing protein [Saprospiraceae bacterium]